MASKNLDRQPTLLGANSSGPAINSQSSNQPSLNSPNSSGGSNLPTASSSATSTEPTFDKALDPDDNAFIQEQIGDSHQDIYFKQWVNVSTTTDTPKKRILVITNFSIFTVKCNLLGRSRRQNFFIVNLSKISTGANSDTLILSFHDNSEKFNIESPRSQSIFQHILYAYQSISYGRVGSDLCDYSGVIPSLFDGYSAPEPDNQDGLLASYLAYCCALDCTIKIPILDYIMTCFQLNDHTFNCYDCLQFIDKDNVKDLTALCSAVRFSNYFEEFIGIDCNFKDPSFAAVSMVFEKKTPINKLVLLNCKASQKGINSLSTALEKGQHSLTYLNLSKNNNIGDSGVIRLTEALESSKKVLIHWSLRDVGLGSKGFVPIVNTLNRKDWLAQFKIIDFSDNKAGKLGSSALATWLQNENCKLEQLYVSKCDLDVEVFLKNLVGNTELIQNSLKILSISGNKFGKKAVPLLCELLTKSNSLQHYFLSDCDLNKSAVVSILEAAINNENANNNTGIQFTLDFSHNDLGAKGAKEIANLYEKYSKLPNEKNKLKCSGIIHTLILAENDFGVEGIVTLCKALSGTRIVNLNLDCNLKTGMFTSGKESGEALAMLIQSTPALKVLSLVGDDNKFYMKNSLLPLLAGLRENNSLTYLDINRNRIGDEGIQALSGSLFNNTTLTGFNIENNKSTITGLVELHKATQHNRFLIDWTIPMQDILKMFKSNNDKKIRQLRSIVHDFEQSMERNEEDLLRRMKKLPTIYFNSLNHGEFKAELETNPQFARERMAIIYRSDSIFNLSLPASTASSTTRISATVLPLDNFRASIHHKKAASRAFDMMFSRAKAGNLGPEQYNMNSRTTENDTGNGEYDNVENKDYERVRPLSEQDLKLQEEEEEGEIDLDAPPPPPMDELNGSAMNSDEDAGSDNENNTKPENHELVKQQNQAELKAQKEQHARIKAKAEARLQQETLSTQAEFERLKETAVQQAYLEQQKLRIQQQELMNQQVQAQLLAQAQLQAQQQAMIQAQAQALALAQAQAQQQIFQAHQAQAQAKAAQQQANNSNNNVNNAANTNTTPSNTNSTMNKPSPVLAQANVTNINSAQPSVIFLVDDSNTTKIASPSTAGILNMESNAAALFKRASIGSTPAQLNSPKETNVNSTTLTPPGFNSASRNSNAGQSRAPQLNTTTTPTTTPPSTTTTINTTKPPIASTSPTNSSKLLDWRTHNFPYESLKIGGKFPDGIDITTREMYLNPSEFQEKFGMTKDAWEAIPQWKKASLKSKLGLF